MAGELTVVNSQVPAEIGELVNFVKLGREQLKIARDGLKMVDKMNLENEKRTAALRQVQELSEQLIDAEMKLGAIMATLPTAPGARTDLDEPEDSAVPRTKQAILKLAGFSVKTAQRFEMLAAHPEIVEKMKVEAHVNGTVLSRTAVLRAINEEENPSIDKKHIALTGSYYIDAIKVFSGRDDDYKEENSGIIKLVRPFDEEEVLSQEWNKHLLLVLPYQDIEPYVQKLCDSFESIPSAIVIMPVKTNQQSFRDLISIANAVVFNEGEMLFSDTTERKDRRSVGVSTKEPYAFIYIGPNKERFFRYFRKYGWGITIGKVLIEKELRYNEQINALPDVKKK